MKYFKFEAMGDTLYIKADTENDAHEVLSENIGSVPKNLLTVTEISDADLPEDDEWLGEE